MTKLEAIRFYLDIEDIAYLIAQIADCKRCPVKECGEQFVSRGSCELHWRKWLNEEAIIKEREE